MFVVLHAKKVKPIWCGHPWVFPKAIATMDGKPQPGDLIQVLDPQQQLIGVGVWNPHSLYRVRMLAYAYESFVQEDLSGIIEQRLRQAQQLRALMQLPNSMTTAYRLCNSEGDGLSGLTVDVYADVAVVGSSAYWVQLHRETIERLLRKVCDVSHIIWKAQQNALKQDGWQDQDANAASVHGIVRDVVEAGIHYKIDFQHMQKTGLFLDQRDNHVRMAALCRGKRVLDLYCYTGGFALHAAKAGAAQVTAVDSSHDAIESAKANALLNHLTVDFHCADVQAHLAQAAHYDVVILDPPKLVPSRVHLPKATRHYRQLHEQLFRVMPQNSLLMTCNCSSAMQWDLFLAMLSEAAALAQRSIQCVEKLGAASDHPLRPAFSEGEYLRAVLVRVV